MKSGVKVKLIHGLQIALLAIHDFGAIRRVRRLNPLPTLGTGAGPKATGVSEGEAIEVALVPVAFVNVKFWSVVDPETVRATALKRDVVAFPSISTEPEKSPLPETESAADGEVVPKPRYPAALITLVRFPDELYISKMLAV